MSKKNTDREWDGNSETINWTPVTSSNVEALAFDNEEESLFVRFHSGGEYEYLNVPYWVFRDFLNAPSKGKFFYLRIKDKFQWVRHR